MEHDPGNLRQEPRYKVDQSATVTVMGAEEQRLEARIEDRSRSGMRLRVPQPVPAGSPLKIQCEEGASLGSIRYCIEERGGFWAGVRLFPTWEALVVQLLAQEAEQSARSNAELQQFAYAVSHDLTEHLRMIVSYLQLLDRRYKGKLDADADEFISHAVSGALRMQTLLKDLLTYSQATRGAMPCRRADCEAALSEALSHLSAQIERAGAVITHDSLPSIVANGTQLVQLLRNLIDNAIKFRREDPPRIHVSAQNTDSSWIFSVRDNGMGIEARYLERIFQVFERLHPQHEYPGAGLGLPTCKMILERHGGRIWAESTPGQGSVFYFSLPTDAP